MGEQLGTAAKAGSRLRCKACGAEAIVTRAEGPELTCCGEPLDVTFVGGA